MKDLTVGAVWRHLLSMATFIGMGLLVQTLYLLVDLYFVGKLGKQAVAGVSSAASATFIVMSACQMISAGGLSLISHALGRKDKSDARLVFEQNFVLSLFMGLLLLLLGYLFAPSALRGLTSDRQTAQYAQNYLFAFLPSLAAMFPGAAIGSALRASGVAAPQMAIQASTVLLNIVLAPVLISGWLSNCPLGVTGAGLASSIASIIGLLTIGVFFGRLQHVMGLREIALPKLKVWRRIAVIGLPATGEFAMIFATTATSYWSIRHFGPQAQAGYGIGSRVMQALFLPTMAIAFAVGPIAGQNFGARIATRVGETFRYACFIGIGVMTCLTLVCQTIPGILVAPFSSDPSVRQVAVELLRINSLNFVAVGLSFCCSGMFQALGNTKPALLSSSSRILTYIIPAIWLSAQSWATLKEFWILSVASVTLQAVLSLFFLRLELFRKLSGLQWGAETQSPDDR